MLWGLGFLGLWLSRWKGWSWRRRLHCIGLIGFGIPGKRSGLFARFVFGLLKWCSGGNRFGLFHSGGLCLSRLSLLGSQGCGR